MENNDHRTYQADGTSELSQYSQLFLKKIGAKNGPLSRQLYDLMKHVDSIYPIRTLRAPRGVTNIAGAKAYAAKFATSPITTMWS